MINCKSDTLDNHIYIPWQLNNSKFTVNDGWKIKTYIGDSQIFNAGQGRYSLEDISKDSIVRCNKILNINKSDIDQSTNPFSFVIETSNIKDFIDYFNITDIENKKQICHFAGSLSNQNIYFWSPSNYMNHGSNDHANIYMEKDEDFIYLIANKDIKKDEELLHDYSKHQFPDWFNSYCQNLDMITPYNLGKIFN